MQRHDVIGMREPGKKSVVQHRRRAGADFLGGLTDQDKGAGPPVLQRGEHPCRADEAGDMHVVGARMHGRRILAGEILHGRGAGVGQTGLLRHRQGVHVAPDHDRGPGSVLQDRHHAGVADLFGDRITQNPQLLGQQGGGAGLHEGELGVGVQVLVDGVERRIVLGDFLRDQVADVVHGRQQGAGGEEQEGGETKRIGFHFMCVSF